MIRWKILFLCLQIIYSFPREETRSDCDDWQFIVCIKIRHATILIIFIVLFNFPIKSQKNQHQSNYFLFNECLIETKLFVINLMLNSSFNHTFYQEQQATIPSDLIFDQIYKNASSKNKYSRNPKYMYYNALLNMKQKLSEQQTPVYNNLFNNIPKTASAFHSQNQPSPQKALMPIYHVEKINKMKFKIYKQSGAQFVQKLPVTDLSFQIKLKRDVDGQFQNQNNKPRLEQILHQYRKMNSTHRRSKSRGGEMRRSSLSHTDNMNIKWIKNTVQRIGKNSTSQRK